MILHKLRRLIKYPSLIFGYSSTKIGELLGQHQFGTDCRVEPLVRVQNPDMISIGEGTFLKNYSVVKAKPPNGINIGENCSVNEFCFLSGNISLGDGVRIANQVSIHSFDHEMDSDKMIHEQDIKMGKVTIGDDVWIGTGSRILKDVNIGEGAVVGAGSVVTKDVPPYTVVGGSPAERISDRN